MIPRLLLYSLLLAALLQALGPWTCVLITIGAAWECVRWPGR